VTVQPPTVLGLEHAGRFHARTECLGGSERIALLALEQLRARGFRVLLACPGDSSLARAAAEREIDVRVFRFLAMCRTRNVRALVGYVRSLNTLGARLGRLCREERVDAVHAFSVIAALYALVAVRRARIPLLVHVQDAQPPRRLRRAVLRLLARRATRLICVSHAVEEMLLGIGVPAEKLVLVYNAVEPRFLNGALDSPAELAGEGPHVGLFAHIIPWKGQQVFLDAAALLATRFPSARFHVVGARMAGVSASYVESLHARAGEPPLAGRVRLDGGRVDVAPWMAAMDVVVHASIAPEAFGLVIAEGMALGKPVVAADCGAPRELVTHGRTGYLAPAGDPRALAHILEHVLERKDPEVGQRAAAASRARFAPEVFGASLKRVYDGVLPGSPTYASGRQPPVSPL
jgi:glycosyltransferase involved in cell wall biosynthesis